MAGRPPLKHRSHGLATVTVDVPHVLRTEEPPEGGSVVTGLAMPFGASAIVERGQRETFEPGAFAVTVDRHRAQGFERLKLYAEHGHRAARLPIGRVTDLVETADGLYFSAVISPTEQGKEVRTLLDDGVIGGVSIGFRPKASRPLPRNGVARTEVVLQEISIVTTPAYDGARVLTVREEQDHNRIRLDMRRRMLALTKAKAA